MSSLLEVNNVYKDYKGRPALNGISLTVGKGKILGLLGPNGSGKTTLIKLINGLLMPAAGSIFVNGFAPGVETKAMVSYLPDKVFLDLNKTVRQTFDYYQDFYADFQMEKAHTMLQNLGINPDWKIKTLSKGNQEKVCLILVMSRNAHLYILDEPIAGVDPATRDYILRTILTNFSEHSSIIISTHLIADVEQILSDVVFIGNGQIILQDNVENLRERNQKSIDQLFREVFRC